MALKNKSLFLYGFDVTANNSSVDFKASSGGPTLLATLNIGQYDLTGLMTEIKRAMQVADPSNTYTITADRTISNGTQNRVTVATSGSFLSLLFSSGPRAASTIAPLIGFNSTDHTGMTSYTGEMTAGTVLIPDFVGYNYLPTAVYREVQGAVNITASGRKEAVVYQIMHFIQAQFKYEPEAKVITQWTPLLDWMIQQRLLEFTPDITDPNTFFEITLETSASNGKGIGFTMKEMLPDFPFFYDSGLMKFRERQD